ncbi:cupin domain-containing protein [Streptomyces sp. SID13666]|uniref:cupin domain-containing protein n=1 Tax=unclassified Streptomyces TaxID=2593676 RepID=UPI0013C18DFE|nr:MULTISPECIES: cupin domain-containing protein [unclassified Streptomyces]NEA56959.1 cupin domain-containing protein [Streptomyces sp. SID13666]NEA74873.1 cupin domain-containing protein [Streptomyces sp. SID13588]
MTTPIPVVVPAVVNISDALARFSDHWAQRKIAGINDYEVKIAKLHGEFVWHTHEDTDEFMLVISGRLTVRFREGDRILAPGEFVVVPRGVEHCTAAEEETSILLLEPAGVVNTGDAGGELTNAVRELEPS